MANAVRAMVVFEDEIQLIIAQVFIITRGVRYGGEVHLPERHRVDFTLISITGPRSEGKKHHERETDPKQRTKGLSLSGRCLRLPRASTA